MTDYMLTGHKCEPIAEAMMDPPREWWVGRLLEPLPDYPRETHCLHISTPLKSVVLGVCEADFNWLCVLGFVATGRHAKDRWVEHVAGFAEAQAQARIVGGFRPSPELIDAARPLAGNAESTGSVGAKDSHSRTDPA